jgi:hypothetical protein
MSKDAEQPHYQSTMPLSCTSCTSGVETEVAVGAGDRSGWSTRRRARIPISARWRNCWRLWGGYWPRYVLPPHGRRAE